MKVLVHALGADMGGAMRHLRNFLPALALRDDGVKYVVLVRESVSVPDPGGSVRLERLPDRLARSWVTRMATDIFSVPARLRRERCAAIVSLTNFGPVWSPVPHVLFQRNALYYCRHYLSRIGGRLRAETLLRRRLTLAAMRRATCIVTPSDAMGKMIRDHYPELDDGRMQTLYHGFAMRAFEEPLDAGFARALVAPGAVKLLFPTHAGLHKGFDVLLEILSELRGRGFEFRLFTTIALSDWPTGAESFRNTARVLGVTDRVVFLGRVPEAQMGALYRSCDLMVYPSLCESFGFSMIEAMGHGLPIVAADTRVNRELCADAAVYYPPLDAAAGAAAITQALRSTTLQRLADAGRARVAAFDWSWDRYARDFSAIVRQVL